MHARLMISSWRRGCQAAPERTLSALNITARATVVLEVTANAFCTLVRRSQAAIQWDGRAHRNSPEGWMRATGVSAARRMRRGCTLGALTRHVDCGDSELMKGGGCPADLLG